MNIDNNATSKIQLAHAFKDILPDVDEFFRTNTDVGVICSINSFCNRVKQLSAQYATRIDESNFKGWSLEMLVEYLIKTNGSDNRIGIWDYKAVSMGDLDDLGVDGAGIGENQNPATVQVKFRAGDYVLTANEDHLSNFLSSSCFDYGVRMEDDKNMLIIHTGLKVAESTMEKMLKNKVRELNRESLREMLDGRPEWWIRFYEAVKASRTEKSAVPPRKLRPHQLEAVELLRKDANGKGKFILPTGCGKTMIQAEAVIRLVHELKANGIASPIVKINSSRILLCFQLFEEYRSHLLANGIEARYVNFNSGNAEDKTFSVEIRKMGGCFREIVSTTSIQELTETLGKAQTEGLPLIVFSTYHSSEKFAKSNITPHMTIHDEAHNLVSIEFASAARLPSERSYYFTATEKTTDDAMGMNNKDVFDDIIYSKSAKEMISVGEMVAPYIHLVKAKKGVTVDLNKLDRDYDALLHSIVDAFLAHKKKVREVSNDPSKIGAKVLVVCRGQQDLIEMFSTKVFDNLNRDYPQIKIYALSSAFGIYSHGLKEKSPVTATKKFKLIKELRGLPSEEDAIIFHVDMIGEGIDVSGITGVMPFRNCELPKFVQNIGRAARLHPEDRARLYACKTQEEAQEFIKNKHLWIKPYSWVIIPQFLLSSDGFDTRFTEIVGHLRDEFGWIPSQHVVIDNGHGLDDDADIDTVNTKSKNRPHSKSGVDAFEHEFEDSQFTILERIVMDTDTYTMKGEIKSQLMTLINGVTPAENPEDEKFEVVD